MKPVNRIISFGKDIFAVILCCLGLIVNINEGVTTRADRFAIVLFVLLLFIALYNLVKVIRN